MKQTLKKTAWMLVLGLLATALCACNTVEGAGRDIEDAGEGIQDAAD
jgi:predicted small secreted protein